MIQRAAGWVFSGILCCRELQQWLPFRLPVAIIQVAKREIEKGKVNFKIKFSILFKIQNMKIFNVF